MASVVFGTFAAPTTNGNDTVISGLTDPKAILLWTTMQTAAGTAAGGHFYLGAATYRASTVSQWYQSIFSQDGTASSSVARGQNTTACLKGYSATTPTVDFECDLVSMDATSITLDWVDAPASAIKVHYMVFQAPGFTDANCAVAATVIAASQDVTVASGFGQPKLLFLSTAFQAFGDVANHGTLSLGATVAAGSRQTIYGENNGSANMAVASYQGAEALVILSGGSVLDAVATADLAAVTDGFRVNYSDQASVTSAKIAWLALAGPAQVAVGSQTTPTAGAPVAADFNAGFAPSGALHWGQNLPTTAGLNTTHAELGGFRMGGFDGTTEGSAGLVEDDAGAISSTENYWSESKSLAMYSPATDPAAATFRSDADASFSGNNVRMTWGANDNVAREYNVLAIGEPVAAVTGATVGIVRSRFT